MTEESGYWYLKRKHEVTGNEDVLCVPLKWGWVSLGTVSTWRSLFRPSSPFAPHKMVSVAKHNSAECGGSQPTGESWMCADSLFVFLWVLGATYQVWESSSISCSLQFLPLLDLGTIPSSWALLLFFPIPGIALMGMDWRLKLQMVFLSGLELCKSSCPRHFCQNLHFSAVSLLLSCCTSSASSPSLLLGTFTIT